MRNLLYTADQAGDLVWTETAAATTKYVQALGETWAEVRTDGGGSSTYWHHTDHLGTTELVTDAAGQAVWSANYEAFGSVSRSNGSAAFTASYTGKQLDEDAGLYYFNARWYDPQLGRFICEDPARDGENWVGYCENNPLAYTDPTGLDPHMNGGQPITGTPYTRENPINQNNLDRMMEYNTQSGTQSCQSAALINAYAAQNPKGISPAQVREALKNPDGTNKSFIDPDGAPNNLDEESRALAKASERDTYLAPGTKTVTDTPKPGPNGGITGETKKDYSHYVYQDSKGKLDSLDPNRPSAAGYKDASYRPLTEEPLVKKSDSSKDGGTK